MKMPISKPIEAKYRGPTSSSEINQMESEKYLDLLELYQQSNRNAQVLRESYQAVIAEQNAMQGYIELLENKLFELESKFDILDDKNSYYNGLFFKTGLVDQMTTTYPSEDQNNGEKGSRAFIDPGYRYATLALNNQIPKTHVLDQNNQVLIPDSLEVEVIGKENPRATVTENDILNAFNDDNNSYWVREVSYDPMFAPEKEEVQIEVSLPTNLVNNLYINTIQIHPHPERGIKISNLEIQYNNTWNQVEGFKQTEIADTIHLSPKKKWYFANKPVQKLRITLEQSNPLQIGDKRTFVLGAQTIGVYLSSFETNGSFVLTPINMENVGMYSIENVEHILSNERALSLSKEFHDLEGQLFDFTILKEENGILIPLTESEWMNQSSRKLWIKTTLYPDPNNSVNPCLHAVRLHYSKA